MLRSLRPIIVLAAGVLAVFAACGPASTVEPADKSATGSAYPRPAVFSNLPAVELIGPATIDAGPAPVFEWRPVDGAATYLLSARGPDRRTWAWTGTETTVRYGSVAEGQAGPTILPGTVWSVSALGPDGTLVAISDFRPVSPTDDAGPLPDWIDPVVETPEAVQTEAPKATGGTCDLLATEEISAAVKGTWGSPELTGSPIGAGQRCTWTSANGSLFSVDVVSGEAYDPKAWSADEDVDGLGDKAFRTIHGLDRRIGFLRGDISVMLMIDFRKVDPEGFVKLARTVDSRLP